MLHIMNEICGDMSYQTDQSLACMHAIYLYGLYIYKAQPNCEIDCDNNTRTWLVEARLCGHYKARLKWAIVIARYILTRIFSWTHMSTIVCVQAYI